MNEHAFFVRGGSFNRQHQRPAAGGVHLRSGMSVVAHNSSIRLPPSTSFALVTSFAFSGLQSDTTEQAQRAFSTASSGVQNNTKEQAQRATSAHKKVKGVGSSEVCGLVKWCHSGAAFLKLPFFQGMRADLMLITDDVAALRKECNVEHTRFELVDAVLQAEIRSFVASANRQGGRRLTGRQFAVRTLYKWQVLRYTEYDFIFYLDPDVDLFHESGGRPPANFGAQARLFRILQQAWTHDLQAYLGSSVELVASIDGSSPINTGVMLLKPSLATYNLGRAVLRTRRFAVVSGFNGSGPPHSVLPSPSSMPSWYPRELNFTHMYRKNTCTLGQAPARSLLCAACQSLCVCFRRENHQSACMRASAQPCRA